MKMRIRADPGKGGPCTFPETHNPALVGSGMESRQNSIRRGSRTDCGTPAGGRMKSPPTKLPARMRVRRRGEAETFASVSANVVAPRRRSVETGKNGKKAERKSPAVLTTDAGKQSRIVNVRKTRSLAVRGKRGEVPGCRLFQRLHHALELFGVRSFKHDAYGHLRPGIPEKKASMAFSQRLVHFSPRF